MISSIGEVVKKVKKIHGATYLLETSICNYEDDFLIRYIKNIKPAIKDCIEIGTYNGLATIVLASAANSVHTFDIAYRDAEFLWNRLYPKLRNKIHYTVGNQDIIDDQINRLFYFNKKWFDINFAFIDGKHTYENVAHDFEMVKTCGRVLFHDANMSQIKQFLVEIGAKIFVNSDNMFAIYEKQK